MVIEKADVGVNILDGEWLVVAVAYIDAVKAGPHPSPLASRGASHQHQQHPEKEDCQSFHNCKGTLKFLKPPNF